MKITHFPYWMITSTTIPRTNSWRGYHPLHPLYSYYSYYCYLLLLLLLLLLTIILCSCWSYDITSTILTYINHITYYSTSTIFRFSRRPQGGPVASSSVHLFETLRQVRLAGALQVLDGLNARRDACSAGKRSEP